MSKLFSSEDVAKLKPLDYEPKILLAWGEAISGNVKMRNWLMKSGYAELGIFTHALRNQNDARIWLVKNGYAHLFAMINGGEGNVKAIQWLILAGFEILANMARYIDRDDGGIKWLKNNDYPIFVMLAMKMRVIKDTIDDNNHDPHKINFS